MQKWLIEETEEVRCPKMGEYFLTSDGAFDIARIDFISAREILRVTELDGNLLCVYSGVPGLTPLSDRLDEWNW
jgi:hypothetical protein